MIGITIAFVWEIRRVDNLPSAMPDRVISFIINLKDQSMNKDSGTYAGKPERPDQHEIDDEEDADPDKSRVVLEAESVGLSFSKPFKTIPGGPTITLPLTVSFGDFVIHPNV